MKPIFRFLLPLFCILLTMCGDKEARQVKTKEQLAAEQKAIQIRAAIDKKTAEENAAVLRKAAEAKKEALPPPPSAPESD